MRNPSLRSLVTVAGLAWAAPALAQKCEDFDSYPTGGSIQGLGRWQGWNNAPAAAGFVSGAFFRSAPNSQEIAGPADSVRSYGPVTTGQWSFTAWQYIPATFGGDTYFILNNVYNVGGPYNWAVQLKFEGASGLVIDDLRPGCEVHFIRGQWAEIRVDFDLGSNTMAEYYNGMPVASGTWAIGGGAVALGAVDLFANNSAPVYYDDMCLTPRVFVPPPPCPPLCDDFDSYTTGNIAGQGGWQGWDNVPALGGTVSSLIVLSAPHSQEIAGSADSVRRYSAVTSGQWSYTAWQYIPGNFAGETYFILNNEYTPPAGPHNWAVQLRFDGSTGVVVDDLRPTECIHFLRDRWVQIRVDLDLTTNRVMQYYDGQLLSSGTWAPNGPIALGAVDLFANNSTAVYYDDFCLTPGSPPPPKCVRGWSGLAGGMTEVTGVPSVLCMTDFNDGTGRALYAAGQFTGAGGIPATRIARWSGAAWTPLASGLTHSTPGPDRVYSLITSSLSGASALYAGGEFDTAGGVPASYVASWNGSTWSALGSGVAGATGQPPRVAALVEFTDSTGTWIYAGGKFAAAGAVPANDIAKWNGTLWSAVGTGLGPVNCLAVYDDGLGGGPALYAGGFFYGVARWNGSVWQVLGGPYSVYSLKVFNDGTGDALYAGGAFLVTGGAPGNCVAKWDGLSWSPLGAGVTVGAANTPETVLTLTVFDDGHGPALYAGGRFTVAGSTAVTHIAKWNGTCWSDPTGGVGPPAATEVAALYPFNDGTGPALYAGGNFTHAASVYIGFSMARWGCAPCYANCDHSTFLPVLNANDFACFLNLFAAADPYANCDGSTTPPILNVLDFACFLNQFAAGCP